MTGAEVQHWQYKTLNYLLKNKDRDFYLKRGIDMEYIWWLSYPGLFILGLHQSMFLNCLELFCNDEQRAKWLPLAQNVNIIGCYAQTELGHGSNVAGLESTAIFDKETDEFVINTPTKTATKWWPGDMGRHANFALLYARLIIDENDYGVVPFLV